MIAWNADEMDAMVDIFEKPTTNEVCSEKAKNNGKYYLGAWLVPSRKTWYAWPRLHLEHDGARRTPKVSVPDQGAVPLYIWYDAGEDMAEIKISDFSGSEENVTWKDIQPAIDAIPSFKKTFKNYHITPTREYD
jgi:hypothetical protein